jgi:lysophospholipase L1-like esterase
MSDFPLHTAATIALVGVALGGVRMAKQPWVAVERVERPAAVVPAPVAVKERPAPLLEDSGGVLDSFYAALQKTEAKAPGAITRIVHYGDSPTTADLITGDTRTILQARYGNAGHGFILPVKPWAWYQHTGTQVEGKGWQIFPASRFQARDGFFGLGGVSFTGAGASARITFEGEGYTRFELWFLRIPDSGRVVVQAGEAEVASVDTAGESGPGFAAFESKEPTNKIELRVTQGKVRLFGLTAENGGPGVVYDSLGLNGASITVLTRMFNEAHWAAELQHRDPALVIVNYGTNEADFASFVQTQYEKELREAIRRLRAALPKASILVMSPMDRGQKDATGEIATMPTIPQIVAIQRRVAREMGCGFFNTFVAMGGEGTMARWYAAHPRLVAADFIHPYPAGGRQIAMTFTNEITEGLHRFQSRGTTAVR